MEQSFRLKRKTDGADPDDVSSKRIKKSMDKASSGEDESSSTCAGVAIAEQEGLDDPFAFRINGEYAKKFEHNKKREELQRLQDKYGQSTKTVSNDIEHNDLKDEGSESSTDSEEEDDDGILASETFDRHIHDTLEAIRKRDPRVYDKNVNFFPDHDEDTNHNYTTKEPPKPMYLTDYHRQNLLGEDTDMDDAGHLQRTYTQQQHDLKKSLVHVTAGVGSEDASDEEIKDFLVEKRTSSGPSTGKARRRDKLDELDVEKAEEDPETFLSKFMSARAWVPTIESRFQPFASDDEEEEQKAEDFEEAYNLRFEDPAKSNEKLTSHARDTAAKYSFRKEESNPRKRAREVEKAKKDAAKQVREQEKARLRKLRVGEAEAKIRKIKEAAGLRGESLDDQDWSAFLEEGWDDARWEREMNKRFGEEYYSGRDFAEGGEILASNKKHRKPRWKDDIDITDLVPDFIVHDEAERPQSMLGDEDEDINGENVSPIKNGRRAREIRKRENDMAEREARKERRKIESIVDQQLKAEDSLSNFGKRHAGNFLYRETSPLTFGLTSQDILMASDSQLNQYAGLKKMAAFRDPDKKRKDKKHLGKKARLRQWRKDTFGNEQGPKQSLHDILAGQQSLTETEMPSGDSNIREGKRRKARKASD